MWRDHWLHWGLAALCVFGVGLGGWTIAGFVAGGSGQSTGLKVSCYSAHETRRRVSSLQPHPEVFLEWIKANPRARK